jgi:hypothetical protein
MVEAAGVEPASEDIPHWRLHTYPEFYFRLSGLLQAGYLKDEPGEGFASFEPDSRNRLSCLVDAHGRTRRRSPVGRKPVLSGYSVIIIVCDYVYSPPFYEQQDPRYATSTSLPPSKPFRPLVKCFVYATGILF